MHFAILRTNVGLTSNIKIMVDSNYKMSLDSIDSNDNLSLDKYKNVKFNKGNYYDELIPYFYGGLPIENAFDIKYDNDSETMSNNFSDQYDEIYQYGARNIQNNKNYAEEFEYFAPLYINKGSIPKKFIIFRVDGPGLLELTSSNFRDEVLRNFKTVKIFDMTLGSQFGEWLNINFVNNSYFPITPLEIDFKSLEFCRWNGIDYSSGGYASKSLFIDDILDEEKEMFELDKFILDSYSNNGVVFPNILNISFLFDDSPATPDFYRKWSLNRYYGFYLDDMSMVQTMSSYITTPLKDGFKILKDNIITDSDGNYPFVEPWSEDYPFYVEYDGNYYKVVKYVETIENRIVKVENNNNRVKLVSVNTPNQVNVKTSNEEIGSITVDKWRIISDINLEGKELYLNKNFGIIDKDGKLIDFNGDDFIINDFDSSDCWLIELDGIYHNLIKDGNSIKINSDYSFVFNQNDYVYRVGGDETTVSMVVDFNNQPKKFQIYKLKFTPIKDFDDKKIETDYSRFEYEMYDDVSNTDETKMYFEDYNSSANPRDLDDFIYKNEVVKIPVSSEYTSNLETFKITDGSLTEFWRKNPNYCRFGYQNSLSSYDKPYLLNNSLIFEDYNRTANIHYIYPNRIERNLDYFYTVNSSSSKYFYHSLHIQDLENIFFRFELDKYLNYGSYNEDYFTYFFNKDIKLYDGKVKIKPKKYSLFNGGDTSIPNNTLFRGIKFNIFNVDNVKLDSNGDIEKINLSMDNKFEDWKFSILLSENDITVDSSGGVTQSYNTLEWDILELWNMDNVYQPNTYVVFDDILYINSYESGPCSPIYNNQLQIISNPYNQGWNFVGDEKTNIFWSPIKSYDNNSLVYNSGEYYSLNRDVVNSSISDFWIPVKDIPYNLGNIVLYKNDYYISKQDNNYDTPFQNKWKNLKYVENWDINKEYKAGDVVFNDNTYYMSNIDQSGNLITNGDVWIYLATKPYEKWKPVEMWNPNKIYSDVFVVYENVVYRGNSNIVPYGEIPGKSPNWSRIWSLVPDTEFKYTYNNNNIIEMNNRYYMCKSNTTDSTLDNGVVVYINKKWKNILVNINISDNTYGDISGVDRDSMYNEKYSKLTASNFINVINDISNKYGFTDYISYVVIEEDGKLSKYNKGSGIIGLPYILKCEEPDSLNVKIESLTKSAVKVDNIIIPTKKLKDGYIGNITELNYYNGSPIAFSIESNKFEPNIYQYYHGGKNYTNNELFRYSGYYMPIFDEIDIFSSDYLKFDDTLTYFGIKKERLFRKVNRNGSVLKLRDNKDAKSMYPMLDEYGYSFSDFFIFKSSWDLKYHYETKK